jgi:hypothetical protein
VSLVKFVDYATMWVNMEFSGTPGGYDLKLINPNTKYELAEGAIQVNSIGNAPPTVAADSDSAGSVGQSKNICVTATDPDGDPLTIGWSLVLQPEGSVASLADPTNTCASLTPDKPGYYLLQVSASDGIVTSYADAVVITAEAATPPPEEDGEEKSHHHKGHGGCSISTTREITEGISTDGMLLLLVPFIAVILRKWNSF